MGASAKLNIPATKQQVWNFVTDIENAKDRITCIKEVEILEQPESGIVGLKWKEKREVFGKEAEETMWITEAVENQYYVTEAINCGCVYHSRIQIEEAENGVDLIMSFKATPKSLFGWIMSPMMFFMKGMVKKAFEKDLQDIRKAFENK